MSFSRCWRSLSLSVRVGGEGRGTRADFVFKVPKYYCTVSVLRQTVLAYCRETRQIVGRAIGGRGEEGCRALWESIPEYLVPDSLM